MVYDLAIAYRVYPGISKSPAFCPDNKYRLVELGLRSLRLALGDSIRVRLFALLDSCPVEYEKLVLKYFDPAHTDLILLDRAGNARTFLQQIDLLLNQPYAELVYFAEDDYLYRPNSFALALDFMRRHDDAHFVTLYDHPDYYWLPLHRGQVELRHSGGHLWRTAGTTCLTFLTRRSILRATAPVFRTYCSGNFDASLWLVLTKHLVRSPLSMLKAALHSSIEATIIAKAWLFGWWRILLERRWKLWCPIPSLATHMESTALAPGVDWHTVAATVEQAYRS
ncbi:MAG: glycosyltransferase family 2 protein [Bacteroidota bacterium]|nr:glycosyltransferase family 2 protein [Bacteroidota bacterium]